MKNPYLEELGVEQLYNADLDLLNLQNDERAEIEEDIRIHSFSRVLETHDLGKTFIQYVYTYMKHFLDNLPVRLGETEIDTPEGKKTVSYEEAFRYCVDEFEKYLKDDTYDLSHALNTFAWVYVWIEW